MGRSFSVGRNRPRGLSLIIDDDDDEVPFSLSIFVIFYYKYHLE